MQKARKLSVTPGTMSERLRNKPKGASIGQRRRGMGICIRTVTAKDRPMGCGKNPAVYNIHQVKHLGVTFG